MADITFKRFDTYPPLTITLTDSNGPIDLSNASGVHMEMKAETGGTIIASIGCASSIATAGKVTVTFPNASYTSMADTWDAEFEIKWANGGVQTVPNTGHNTILIEADIEAS